MLCCFIPTYSAIGNMLSKVLSLSEMYQDPFYKSKEIQLLMQTIDKKELQTN